MLCPRRHNRTSLLKIVGTGVRSLNRVTKDMGKAGHGILTWNSCFAAPDAETRTHPQLFGTLRVRLHWMSLVRNQDNLWSKHKLNKSVLVPEQECAPVNEDLAALFNKLRSEVRPHSCVSYLMM